MSFIDRFITAVSPEAGLRRELARQKASALGRARMLYDGATMGRRSQGWRLSGSDANAENKIGAVRLRENAREMVQNNAYAARGKRGLADNVIGLGIFPSIEGTNKTTTKKLESMLVDHFDTTACDVTGQLDLYGLQWLAFATAVESGECLIRRRLRKFEDKLPVPFQLEVLEPDYLDINKSEALPNGGWIVQGIEFDPIGRRAAYWLFDQHPGSVESWAYNNASRRVDAANVAHLYRVDRPGQVRGVTWFAPVIVKLRDLADYSDAQLMRQKIAACFAAFITSDEDIGSVIDEASDAESTADFTTESLEPGLIQRLKPGEAIEFANPPAIGEYEAFKRVELREIALGLGMSYEALTGDLSNVNFSSGRMGDMSFKRTIVSSQNFMMIPQVCTPMARWFLEAANLMGVRTDDAKVKWTCSPREMVNPSEEIKASVMAIRAGLSSRSNEQRKLGFDPLILDQENADDNARADQQGLIFDTDPRKVTSVGNPAQMMAPADNAGDANGPPAN